MKKDLSVLIAEDDPLNMKLFKDLLEIKNIGTICVSDGNRVLEETLKNKPDLILMDIRLRNISGVDIIKRIKKHKDIRHIPIIALTAFALKGDKERILQSGCEAYIPKPVSVDKFFDTVKNFIPISA